MSNININSIVQNFSDLVTIYFIILLSLLLTSKLNTKKRALQGTGIILYVFFFLSLAHASTIHATCGTDVELTCPINSLKKSNEVVRIQSVNIVRFFL